MPGYALLSSSDGAKFERATSKSFSCESSITAEARYFWPKIRKLRPGLSDSVVSRNQTLQCLVLQTLSSIATQGQIVLNDAAYLIVNPKITVPRICRAASFKRWQFSLETTTLCGLAADHQEPGIGEASAARPRRVAHLPAPNNSRWLVGIFSLSAATASAALQPNTSRL